MNAKDSSDINFLSVNVSFGFAASFGVVLAGKTSGAHMNPAVSLAMLMTGRLTILRFCLYILGQLIGAFVAAATVFLVYLDSIKSFHKGMYSLQMAGIFCTFPSANVSNFGGFVDQFFGTFLLVIIILGITDTRNHAYLHGIVAVLVGLTIMLIGTSFGYNCGYAVNPARDFGLFI
jgi:MIP family channel proteins